MTAHPVLREEEPPPREIGEDQAVSDASRGLGDNSSRRTVSAPTTERERPDLGGDDVRTDLLPPPQHQSLVRNFRNSRWGRQVEEHRWLDLHARRSRITR